MIAARVRALLGRRGWCALARALRVATEPTARGVTFGWSVRGQPLPCDARAHARRVAQGQRMLCGCAAPGGPPPLPEERELRLEVAPSERDERSRRDDRGSLRQSRAARDLTLPFVVEGDDQRQKGRGEERIVMGPLSVGLLPEDAEEDGALSPGATAPNGRRTGRVPSRWIGAARRVGRDAPGVARPLAGERPSVRSRSTGEQPRAINDRPSPTSRWLGRPAFGPPRQAGVALKRSAVTIAGKAGAVLREEVQR